MASIDGIEDHSEANIAGEDDEEVYNLYVDNTATIYNLIVTGVATIAASLAGSIVPTVTNTYNLGTSLAYWANAFVTTLTVNTIGATGATPLIGSSTAPFSNIFTNGLQVLGNGNLNVWGGNALGIVHEAYGSSPSSFLTCYNDGVYTQFHGSGNANLYMNNLSITGVNALGVTGTTTTAGINDSGTIAATYLTLANPTQNYANISSYTVPSQSIANYTSSDTLLYFPSLNFSVGSILTHTNSGTSYSFFTNNLASAVNVMITANISWAAVATGTRHLFIKLNSTNIAGASSYNTSTLATLLSASTIISVPANGIITISVIQSSGSSMTLSSGYISLFQL